MGVLLIVTLETHRLWTSRLLHVLFLFYIISTVSNDTWSVLNQSLLFWKIYQILDGFPCVSLPAFLICPFQHDVTFVKYQLNFFFKSHHGDHSWNALQHIWNCKHCLERSVVTGAWICTYRNAAKFNIKQKLLRWMPGRYDLSQQESHLGYYTVCFV